MRNLISRTQCGLDLTDETITTAVKLSTRDNKRFFVTSALKGGSASLLTKGEPIAVVLGELESRSSVVANVNEYTVEAAKKRCGITASQNYAYLAVERANCGLLTALNRDIAAETIATTRQMFADAGGISVNHIVVVLLYLYYRCVKKTVKSVKLQQERVALLHCTSQFLSLLVIDKDVPVWTGMADIRPRVVEITPAATTSVKPEVSASNEVITDLTKETYQKPTTQTVEIDTYQEVYALLQTANEQTNSSHYDRLILCGECDLEDAQALYHCAANVELFSIENGSIEIGDLTGITKKELQDNVHRFAIAIGAAAMAMEELGVDLSNENGPLIELPLERYRPESMTGVHSSIMRMANAGAQIVPEIFIHKRIMIFSLIIAAIIFGGRYWSAERLSNELQREKAIEVARADSLKDVSAKYDFYRSRIAVVKAQRTAIDELRKQQLLVRTVIDEIDRRIPAGLVFTDLNIQSNSILIKGYAPTRPAVADFAITLGKSVTTFANVAPVYDDLNNTGNFEIKAAYIGPVPVNLAPNQPFGSTTTQMASQTKRGNEYGK